MLHLLSRKGNRSISRGVRLVPVGPLLCSQCPHHNEPSQQWVYVKETSAVLTEDTAQTLKTFTEYICKVSHTDFISNIQSVWFA